MTLGVHPVRHHLLGAGLALRDVLAARLGIARRPFALVEGDAGRCVCEKYSSLWSWAASVSRASSVSGAQPFADLAWLTSANTSSVALGGGVSVVVDVGARN